MTAPPAPQPAAGRHSDRMAPTARAPRTVRLCLLGFGHVARALCDRHQILVSGGYHCAHILHHRLHLDGTVRASTHVFNTHAEIDLLADALKDIATA